ncbi:hypothetical protein CRYUN_Cryun18bG0033700 [Craigia yunnanensis]
MKVENENVDPVTDVGLALGYSNHSIQRRLSNDLGAGANAASRIDMTFVANDPLSELVWSPQKGPSLNCTNCIFSDKEHSLVWGSGPSNVVLSPQQMNTSARSRTAGFIEEISSKRGESDQNPFEKNDLVDSKGAYVCFRDKSRVADIAEAMESNFPSLPDERKPVAAKIESLFNYHANEARDVGSGTQLSRMEMVLASEVNTENECEACGGPSEKNLTSPGSKLEESASIMEKKGKSKMKGGISPSFWPLEKLEATAENDLQTLMGDNALVATSKSSGSESTFEVKKNFQHHKEIPPEKMSTDKHSPTDSRIRRCRRKGKEKALSDGDVKGMMSKEEDDTHESVESCNSAVFSTGKKRWGFEQQLTVGSKRVKKKIDESPCSSSFVKQDSSFMNWISNMMKGFLKSKDETPFLALTVANPHQSHESPNKNLDTSDKNWVQKYWISIYFPLNIFSED